MESIFVSLFALFLDRRQVQCRLQFFRGGGVWGKGTNANVVMSEVARNLSDEEIQALATYIEGLHGASATAAAE